MYLTTDEPYRNVAPVLVLDKHECMCGCNRFKYDIWCLNGEVVKCCQCNRTYKINMKVEELVDITEHLTKQVDEAMNIIKTFNKTRDRKVI